VCCDIDIKNVHIPREDGVIFLLVKIYSTTGEKLSHQYKVNIEVMKGLTAITQMEMNGPKRY
jgi:hypothetical protein